MQVVSSGPYRPFKAVARVQIPLGPLRFTDTSKQACTYVHPAGGKRRSGELSYLGVGGPLCPIEEVIEGVGQRVRAILVEMSVSVERERHRLVPIISNPDAKS